MKTFFTILLALFSFTLSASEKEDFKDYILRGKLEETHMYGDFYAKNYFNIYNNMIFYYGESDTAFVDKFPDGEFELVTRNNSKIRVNVTDGMLNNLIVYDEESFRKNEKKVDENNYYCENGYFYGMMYYLYGKEQYKNIAQDIELKYPDGRIKKLSEGYYIYKEKDKYIIFDYYGEETIIGPNFGQVDVWFDAQSGRLTDTVERRFRNESEEHSEPTVLKIKDCLLIYYNDDYISFE